MNSDIDMIVLTASILVAYIIGYVLGRKNERSKKN